MSQSRDEIVAHLNAETGRIEWKALLPHFARGQVVRVSRDLDLLEAAAVLARDEREQVRQWMEEGVLGAVDDDTAGRWQHEERHVWAVVVAPWVLVQEAGDP